MGEIAEKKLAWEKVREKSISRIEKITSESKELGGAHLIDSNEYNELKRIVNDGDFGSELKVEHICHGYYGFDRAGFCFICSPTFPIIRLERGKTYGTGGIDHFVSPTIGANEVKLYSQLTIPKEVVLGRLMEVYKTIEKSPINQFNRDHFDNLSKIIDLALDGKEKQARFRGINDYRTYDYEKFNICDDCLEKGILKEAEEKYKVKTMEYLSKIGLDKRDYELKTRIEKELIWSPK